MGKRGPAKRPTNLSILQGERPDRINFDGPRPIDGTPDIPDDVTGEVLDVWKYTVTQLQAMKTLSMADRDTLHAYCEAVVLHRKACRILAEDGILTRGSTVQESSIKHPAVQIQRDAAAAVRVLAREFGLTPSARSEIRMSKESSAQGAERLLS